jgi:hypothetical protein
MVPKTPSQLSGGCFCSAIRYRISVPELSERKEMPKLFAYTGRRLAPLDEVSERMPIVTLDYCTSCRRIPGTILDSWVVCPRSWVKFTRSPFELLLCGQTNMIFCRLYVKSLISQNFVAQYSILPNIATSSLLFLTQVFALPLDECQLYQYFYLRIVQVYKIVISKVIKYYNRLEL